MNIAVIFAGGTGQRMTITTKPKQFLEYDGKSILAYTIEKFQNHPRIEGIIVACLEDWIPECKKIVEKHGFTKVKAVVPGGETGQMTIYNGLEAAEKLFSSKANVLVHDGVRPLVDEETITKAIDCVEQKGSAITVVPAIETIIIRDKNTPIVNEIINRSEAAYARAPQCFVLQDLLDAHRKAQEEKNINFIDSACLMKYYGHNLHTIEGKAENIKITTPIDYYMFCAVIGNMDKEEE